MSDGKGNTVFFVAQNAQIKNTTMNQSNQPIQSQVLFKLQSDEMSPTIEKGWMIRTCKIDLTKLNTIEKGIYLITFQNITAIGRVDRDILVNDGIITLYPDNRNYEPKKVHISSIESIFKAESTIMDINMDWLNRHQETSKEQVINGFFN